jgi:hypothetical protein
MRALTLFGAAAYLCCSLTLVPTPVEAAITAVTIDASRPYEAAAGYTCTEITVHGSVARADGTTGVYAVPAVLIHPGRGRGNGVGVVDWLNSAFYHFFPADHEFGTFQFTLLATGTYLFDEGYTYLSIQWDKKVTETFGPTAPREGEHNRLVYGTIERSADAWEILLDAARLLKDPGVLPLGERPGRVTTVLSSGYSQGGALQLELLTEGLDPGRVYDGHLMQMIGLACWKRTDAETDHFGFLGDCRALPSAGGHAPAMLLASESDMLVYHPTVLGPGKSAFFARQPANPTWRQYEMAGVSHLPKPVFDLAIADQGTGDPRPVFRAAFANLTRWVHGTHRQKPPASRYFAGHAGETDAFVPVLDADGHFAGGLRLPHVESTVERRRAGAPLGRHAALNPAGQNPFHPFVFLGGTFARFADDDLRARYPSRLQYVTRVARAANALAAKGYITGVDRRALIAAAVDEPLPCCRRPPR